MVKLQVDHCVNMMICTTFETGRTDQLEFNNHVLLELQDDHVVNILMFMNSFRLEMLDVLIQIFLMMS
jgi:hypothetical protein